MSYRKLLVILFWLVALHSFCVGIAMIVLPIDLIAYFNIPPSEHRFFITQGGVFHVVMSFAYIMVALNIDNNNSLIKFSIVAKFCATLFLFTYFVFVNQFGLIFLSAIGDFCMGLLMLVIYRMHLEQKSE